MYLPEVSVSSTMAQLHSTALYTSIMGNFLLFSD